MLYRTAPVALVLLVLSNFFPARAGTLYWDTDGSTVGNNASTGANLGHSSIWSAVVNPVAYGDYDWWDTSLATNHAWTSGSDAVFWGTAGTVSVFAGEVISVNSVAFKTTGYSVNSIGTLLMTGFPSIPWTPGWPQPSAHLSPARTRW